MGVVRARHCARSTSSLPGVYSKNLPPPKRRKISQTVSLTNYGFGDELVVVEVELLVPGDELEFTFVSVLVSVLLAAAGDSFTTVVLFSVLVSAGGLVTVVSLFSHAVRRATLASTQM